ncbi:hypothetical protein NKH74_33130 [Mesorhizobium sp. M0933]|uniref:hypothetical protein n=1 Tax=Mesorhizobium sp. M0933 TaxID=2957030 RepID=UPI00333789A3
MSTWKSSNGTNMPASLKEDPEREREPDMQVIRSPVLRRQEVRDVFNSDVAAFNQVIFDSLDAASEVEATDLNADVDPMVRKECPTTHRVSILRNTLGRHVIIGQRNLVSHVPCQG